MGHPDGAHTHGGGGGFDPMPILIIIGAVLVAGPVLAAVAELIHLLLIVLTVLAATGAAGLVAYIALRVRHRRQETPRVVHHITPAPQGPSPSLSAPRARPAIGRPAELHVHFHGLAAEDVAAIIERDRQDG